ncbi:hypothetical protein BJ912DRAFT_963772, partial [Pholiota molesta]
RSLPVKLAGGLCRRGGVRLGCVVVVVVLVEVGASTGFSVGNTNPSSSSSSFRAPLLPLSLGPHIIPVARCRRRSDGVGPSSRSWSSASPRRLGPARRDAVPAPRVVVHRGVRRACVSRAARHVVARASCSRSPSRASASSRAGAAAGLDRLLGYSSVVPALTRVAAVSASDADADVDGVDLDAAWSLAQIETPASCSTSPPACAARPASASTSHPRRRPFSNAFNGSLPRRRRSFVRAAPRGSSAPPSLPLFASASGWGADRGVVVVGVVGVGAVVVVLGAVRLRWRLFCAAASPRALPLPVVVAWDVDAAWDAACDVDAWEVDADVDATGGEGGGAARRTR